MQNDKNIIFGNHVLVESVIADYWKNRLDPEVSDEELAPFRQWYSCIVNYSELVLDIEKSDFIELAQNNPLYKQLLKESASGGSKLVFWKNFMSEMDSGNRYLDFPDALYLLSIENEKCIEKSEYYGLYFLNLNRCLPFSQLLFMHTDFIVKKTISKSDLKTWDDLSKVIHPVNSLIITDNYVLKSVEDIASNLIPILNALLPKKLSMTSFQLLIVTQSMEEQLLQSRYSYVEDLIQSRLNRPYVIEFSLATACIGENHDRYLFTNYFMIRSGNSFNYFNRNGKAKFDTYLNVFPTYHVAAGPELMKNKIRNVLSGIKSLVIDHSIQKSGPCNFANNRLFALTS